MLEASQVWLMRQFYHAHTQSFPNPHTLLLRAKRAVGCVCSLSPPAYAQSEKEHGQIRHRHCHWVEPTGIRTQSQPAPSSYEASTLTITPPQLVMILCLYVYMYAYIACMST